MKALAEAILVADGARVWIWVVLQVFLDQLMISGIYMRCNPRAPYGCVLCCPVQYIM